MGYLIYNGQRVISSGKFMGGPPVIDVLDFDGSTYVQFDNTMDLPLNSLFDVTFGMYLDQDSGYNRETFFFNCDTSGSSPTKNIISAYLFGDKLRIWGGSSSNDSARECSITGFANQNVNVTITCDNTQVGNFVRFNDVKFNGVSQPLTNNGTTFDYEDTFRVGVRDISYTPSLLKNATIWDLKVDNDYWIKGYTGDQNSAWAGQISSLEGTLTTIPVGHLPDIKTRKIILI